MEYIIINIKSLSIALLLLVTLVVVVAFIIRSKQKNIIPSTKQLIKTVSRPQVPMRGPSRETLIKILNRLDAETHLPIRLAKYRPDAVVQKEGDRWVIRALVDDKEAQKKAFDQAVANGKSFMDENTWPFRYAGPILVEGKNKEDFINKIKNMRWDYGEEDGRGETPFLRHK